MAHHSEPARTGPLWRERYLGLRVSQTRRREARRQTDRRTSLTATAPVWRCWKRRTSLPSSEQVMLRSSPAFVIPKHCGPAVVKWPLVPCWFADLILWYFLKADFFLMIERRHHSMRYVLTSFLGDSVLERFLSSSSSFLRNAKY